MGKGSGGKMHHVAKQGAVKVSSAPFSSSWSNNRPMASSGGTKSSPAGSQTQYRDQGKRGVYRGRRGA